MQYLEIYVGGDIVHRSELDVIQALSEFSETHAFPLMVLANVTLAARQIDFIIVSERGVHVVDAKSTVLPVRGGENGDWSRLQADGTWCWYTNGYAQVLDCKNVLRDALKKDFQKSYPEAAVVFSGGLPQGSTVTTGDFKASVTDIPGLLESLDRRFNNPLTFEAWRVFAKQLVLRKATVAGILAPDLDHPLRLYQDGFRDQYAPAAARWIPESEDQQNEIRAAAKSAGGLYLQGSSGCAKSLAATSLAVEANGEGALVVFLAAKQYSGSISALIAAEVAQVADVSWSTLAKAVQRTGTPLHITLDGLNELKSDEAKSLLRGIKAVSRRYGARLTITSQHEKPGDLSGLATFRMPLPSLSLKERIATAHAKTKLGSAAIALLPAVRSGIEAAALGELQDELPSTMTRVQLIDQFIRHRVGDGARRSLAALRELARHLMDQTAFSLSEAAYDIVLEKWGYSADQGDALLRSGILVRHAGRISFLHEMYCNGCASMSYAHDAAENTDDVIRRLNAPVFRSAAADVLAALEDEKVCHDLLSQLVHPHALVDALKGNLGAISKKAGERLVDELLDLVRAEISLVELELLEVDKGHRLEWKGERCTTYSDVSTIHLKAIGTWAQLGGGLDAFMALCREMDAKLRSERIRLSGAAKAAKFPLRSNSYALAFHGHWGTRIGFAHIFGATQPLFDRYKGPAIASCGTLSSLTPGELQFVVEHFTLFFGEDRDAFIGQLTDVFRNNFEYQPYHVMLAMLHVVGYAREASETHVSELIDALSAIDANRFGWAISTSIVDALRILGGLEEDAESSRPSIKEEIQGMLAAPEAEETFERALGLYCASYDHPFDYVYAEEIHSLPDVEKGKLYRRALQAPSIRHSMSLRWLTDEVAETGDASDLSILARFAGLPSTDNPMRQDEIAAFVTAVRFHGRHGARLPDVLVESEGDQCFASLRMIVYAAEQGDHSGAETAWSSLKALNPALVLACVCEVAEALVHYPYPARQRSYGDLKLTDMHSAHLLALSRSFARAGEPARSARGYPEERGTRFAMSILGSHGDRGDLASLRVLLERPEFSDSALEAIKSIERRG